MVTFSTPELVKWEGNIPLIIDDLFILPHISKASAEIRRLITPELYNTILTYSNLGTDDDEYKMFLDLQIAETNLSLGYFIPSLNMQTSGNGIMKSKGWDQTRIDLYNQDELKILADGYKKTAYDLINLYIPIIPYANDDDDDNFNLPGNFYFASI